jgi:hypothetical protein
MVTYQEFREIQRIKERSNLGPGSTEYMKPFASDVHNKTDFGAKYEFKPDNNPPPGLYDTIKSKSMVLSNTSFMAVPGKGERSDFTKVAIQEMPDAGNYDTTSPFGSGMKKVNFGRKYKFSPNSNPPPGLYDVDKAKSQVHKKTSFMAVPNKEKRSDFTKVALQEMPDAGKYDATTPFGSGMKKVNFGNKYKFTADSNPPPGAYDADKSKSFIAKKSAFMAVPNKESRSDFTKVTQ